jgi:hypothetical protein
MLAQVSIALEFLGFADSAFLATSYSVRSESQILLACRFLPFSLE